MAAASNPDDDIDHGFDNDAVVVRPRLLLHVIVDAATDVSAVDAAIVGLATTSNCETVTSSSLDNVIMDIMSHKLQVSLASNNTNNYE